ncbi:MAG TPA: OmpA family protein [Coxiellaceae bacterium]|nr:OmpA family protein [Coxiellaceae bacterium]
MKLYPLFVSTMLLALIVSACEPMNPPQTDPLGTTSGEAVTQSDALPSQDFTVEQHLLAELQSQGVLVVEKGDQLRLIIPTDTFFMAQSSEVKESKLPDLALIASVLKTYPHSHINVYGYSDNIRSRTYGKNLSLEYAQVVAAYLWNAGVEVNRIKGLGNQHRVASHATPQGGADNRRVEILVS